MIERDGGSEQVDCAEIVYRALRKAWVVDTTIDPAAFIRRVEGLMAEDAISFFRRKYVTARECRSRLRKIVGCASLHAGSMRDLPGGIDVSPDPLRDDQGAIIEPGHCLLINLPDPVTESEAAEFAASQLVKIARFVTPDQEEREHRERRGSV
jgi:hypothetical protein